MRKRSEQISETIRGLHSFSPASEELIWSRRLLKRVETKFILNIEELEQALENMPSHYAVIMTQSAPQALYENLYYDTKDFHYLNEHLCGKRPRYKVRFRHYIRRGMSFLEVKKKLNNTQTIKQRLPVQYMSEDLSEHLDFVNACSAIPGGQLLPCVRIKFQRITLVGLDSEERITMDVGLCFEQGNEQVNWKEGIIVEVKQHRHRPRTPVMLELRGIGARSLSISKYCVAASLLHPNLKINAYSPKLHQLRKYLHD